MLRPFQPLGVLGLGGAFERAAEWRTALLGREKTLKPRRGCGMRGLGVRGSAKRPRSARVRHCPDGRNHLPRKLGASMCGRPRPGFCVNGLDSHRDVAVRWANLVPTTPRSETQ